MKKVIALFVTCLIIVSCAYAMPAQAEKLPEFYPKLAVVINIRSIGPESCVYCIDRNGDVWGFYSQEDDEKQWKVGDVVNFLMWNYDNIPEHNEIIEVYYETHTDNFEEFFRVHVWRL